MEVIWTDDVSDEVYDIDDYWPVVEYYLYKIPEDFLTAEELAHLSFYELDAKMDLEDAMVFLG